MTETAAETETTTTVIAATEVGATHTSRGHIMLDTAVLRTETTTVLAVTIAVRGHMTPAILRTTTGKMNRTTGNTTTTTSTMPP
mmetsp:Transcript_25691/g.67222  ORF Transcript_25691/g.67222 Transcript_25691/m.67222 type:complete len:84 (-) Transcript_25691:1110-1361(-)